MNLKARTDEELGDSTYHLSQYKFKQDQKGGENNVIGRAQ